MFDPDKLRRLAFSAASKIWLDSRKPYLKTRTHYGYGHAIKQLNLFFGQLVLAKIHCGHLREYQQARAANADGFWPQEHGAGASLINHELSVVQMVLKRADLWKPIAPHYEPLPMPDTRPPKVMSDTEEIRLFAIAASNPEWQLAYWAATITCMTGASGTELRHLRFEDVHLDGKSSWIRIDDKTAKNQFRGRVIVLNRTAEHMVRCCQERANSLGSGKPSDFVFPHRVKTGKWDPTRAASASWLRHSFPALRDAAGLPWLTPHCLRHQHITLSMESNEPMEQISLRVGHVSEKMTRWYLGSRRETQQAAVDKLDPSVRFGPSAAGVTPGMRRSAK